MPESDASSPSDFASKGWRREIKFNNSVELRPVDPSLWRKTFKRLRKQFLSARERLGPLPCKLFQTTQSQSDMQSPPDDYFKGGNDFQCKIYHLGGQYFTEDGKPLYLKHPILDVDGKPIVDLADRGLFCALPTSRQWALFGTPFARSHWNELADRAGIALLGSPPTAVNWLPKNTLLADNQRHRWLWSLFDLAWYEFHPVLRAEKKTWLPLARVENEKTQFTFLPYNQIELRELRHQVPSYMTLIPEAWTERPPGYFVSELADVFQASADLIEELFYTPPSAGQNQDIAPPEGQAADGAKSAEKVDEPLSGAKVKIPPRGLKAASEYMVGLEALGDPAVTDSQVYEKLVEKWSNSGEANELPSFDSWQRNLREYRRVTNQQKNKPRAGRTQGLVKADQIEPEALPTRVRRGRKDKSE